MSAAAAAAAFGAVLLLAGPGPHRRAARGVRHDDPLAPRARPGAFPVSWSRGGIALAVLAVLAVLVLVSVALVCWGQGGRLASGIGSPLVLVTALVALTGVLRVHAGHRRRRVAARASRHVLEVVDALVAELRAGQPATRALRRVGEQHALLAGVVRSADLGGDPVQALRASAAAPGCAGLRDVAAAWRVAETTGAGLAPALLRVADGLRAQAATHDEVAASLGPARATARLLAVLPLFGLALGSGLGGDPVHLLLRTPPGNALLLAGVVLVVAGTWWVERLADGVLT